MLELNFEPFPILITERLVLRRMELEDADEILFLRSNERVMQYIDRRKAKTREEATEFIHMIQNLQKNNVSVLWAICLHPGKKLIGTICIWNIDAENYRGEVGYVLHPDYYGKGIMHEAMQKVLNYGFHDLQLHAIEAHVNPANSDSIKLLERNNFVREAYFKDHYYFEGIFKDTAIYTLLTSEGRV
jgi:[ribosomal protein S5]-alanine N-acetyltransferase